MPQITLVSADQVATGAGNRGQPVLLSKSSARGGENTGRDNGRNNDRKNDRSTSYNKKKEADAARFARSRATQYTARLDLVQPGRPVAVDLEGVKLIENGMTTQVCGRITIVREDGVPLLDTFTCFPQGLDIRLHAKAHKLGAYNKDIKHYNGAQPLSHVLNMARSIFDKSGVIVGHDIKNDKMMMRGIESRKIAGIDFTKYEIHNTQTYQEYRDYVGHKQPGLAVLAAGFLNCTIQNGVEGHDSLEDTKATMDLFKPHVAKVAVDTAAAAAAAAAAVTAASELSESLESVSLESSDQETTTDSAELTDYEVGAVEMGTKW